MLEKSQVLEIENILGYKFKDKSFLQTAFTHSSYANIKNVKSNERLEFFGDALLETIISEKIYFDVDYAEGNLSKLRSRIVSTEPLANLADSLGLSKYLMYVGNLTPKMKADLIESTIASIYLDGGMEATKKYVSRVFGGTVRAMENLTVLADSKSYLQEVLGNADIKYTYSKTGADHDPTYLATVIINGEVCGRGSDSKKKEASKKAASEALKKLTKESTYEV